MFKKEIIKIFHKYALFSISNISQIQYNKEDTSPSYSSNYSVVTVFI